MKPCPTCGHVPPKTDSQRSKFHAMCGEIGDFIGLTTGQVKQAIKEEFYGVDTYRIGTKLYREIKSTEKSDREEYSKLIDFTYRWAAENCDYYFEYQVTA